MRFLILAMFLLSGCGWGSTQIDRINKHPGGFQGRSVTVRGRVIWAGPIPEAGINGFRLEQRGAEILVLSRRSVSPSDRSIKISGHVETFFDLGDRRALVLIDEDPGPRGNGGAADVR